MGNESSEKKKRDCFIDLMYSFNWKENLEEQLANNFNNYEAVSYIHYIIEHLTPQYKQTFLENIYNDNSIFDEVKAEDYKNCNSLADLNAHIRFYNCIEKEFDNLKPLLQAIKEEKRYELSLIEKAERFKKVSSKYSYTGLKLLADNNFNEVVKEFYLMLIEDKLISKTTSIADFSRIFRGVNAEIFLDNRVIWLKSISALKLMIDELIKAGLIEPLPKSGKWQIVCNCFCNADKIFYTSEGLRTNHEPVKNEISDKINVIIKSLIEDI